MAIWLWCFVSFGGIDIVVPAKVAQDSSPRASDARNSRSFLLSVSARMASPSIPGVSLQAVASPSSPCRRKGENALTLVWLDFFRRAIARRLFLNFAHEFAPEA